jgi:hypothetical protein
MSVSEDIWSEIILETSSVGKLLLFTIAAFSLILTLSGTLPGTLGTGVSIVIAAGLLYGLNPEPATQ